MSNLLLVDGAVKGTALLMLAAAVVLMLRRASAATRHLAWLVAIVALLVMPLLSAMLPQWQVLPGWATITTAKATPVDRPAVDSPPAIQDMPHDEVESPPEPAYQPTPQRTDSRPEPKRPPAVAAPAVSSWNWLDALPLVWAIGLGVLIARLLVAHGLLWRIQRQARAVENGDPLVAALQAASLQLGLRRRVALLVHPHKTIPLVWGVFRCRLLLPTAARQWSGEQLRSVLLHELAHIQRRDMIWQLLAQVACAMHWFNPLAWLAAGRLAVERERACDDLVLASGVRPSAYAEHLLEIVTGFSSVRWTHACGLAMARASSLEGRLALVLSKNHSRRRVSAALAAIALATAVGIAVPIAMLRAASEESPSAKPPPTPPAGENPAAESKPQPKDKQAQALFTYWQANARLNGSIPEGLVSRLREKVKEFIRNNTGDASGDPYAKKMLPLVPRFETRGDWPPADAMALLDDVAAANTIPLHTTMEEIERRTIKTGNPLPKELVDAPWGEPHASGLRLAWLLEPRAAEHRLGTPLKSHILLHNSGKTPVVFRTRNWHQDSGHKARDAKGAEVTIDSTFWTTRGQLLTYRLAPGEFVELNAAGIGVGARGKDDEDWQGTRVGSWIEAKADDEVMFAANAVPLYDWNEEPPAAEVPPWWQDFVAERLGRELPLPAMSEERTALLNRVTKDLFGATPTSEETAAFLATGERDALDALTKRLIRRPGQTAVAGDLTSGVTKFRVLPPDPDAAKKPRTASNPGRYTLGDHIRLVVSRRPEGERIVNEGSIQFFSPDPKSDPPGRPVVLPLPDGYNTWAAAWVRGGTVLWLQQKSGIRRFDFTDPAEVKEEAAQPDKVPAEIRDAIRAALPKDSPEPKASAKPDTRPKDKDARALFQYWQENARTDGNIPGGLIGRFGDKVQEFIKNNTGNPTGGEAAKQMTTLVPRFVATRDWMPDEAAALLDDVAAVYTMPLQATLREANLRKLTTGAPLPKELAGAPWGEALPSGLRLAWLLEPRAAQYRLGTPLESRVVIHNRGKKPVVFRTADWHQDFHTASDAKGAEIKVEGDPWLTLSHVVQFRLAPGEFVGLASKGVGIGAKVDDNWQGIRVGTWIHAKVGDDVTLTTSPVPLLYWKDDAAAGGEPRWWLDFIKERLNLAAPLPGGKAERELLLDRAVKDLFGDRPSAEEISAFVGDREPTALDSLAKRLAHRSSLHVWAGPLTSGPTKFRVLPADPDAAKKPRVARNPGWYTLGEKIVLSVTRRPIDERIANEASIRFFPADSTKPAPGEPHEVKLPDGHNTWAAAWMRDSTVLWVQQKGSLRSYDFTDPAKVKETVLESGKLEEVPQPIRDALRTTLTP